MDEKKSLRKILAGMCLLFFLSAVIPGVGTAAPAEKPITGKEWMEKSGMDWGSNYWPTIGELNGMQAFMSGKLKVSGDIFFSQSIASWFKQVGG